MIHIIDSSFDREAELFSLCENSPFGCRILSVYQCYGVKFDFVDIWYQLDLDNHICCVISSFENNFTVMLNDKADIEEIRAFLNFKNPSFILADSRYYISDLEKSRCGDVLRYDSDLCFDSDVSEVELSEAYSLMKSNESKDFPVPSYQYFLSDAVHRKNLGKFSIFGIKKDELLSVAMSVAQSDKTVVIGSIATNKKYQKQGLGKRTVKHIASTFLSDKSMGFENVFVFCSKTNTPFYQKTGFTKIFEFTEYIKR